MVLDVLMGMLWMFGVFCLIWWNIEHPIYDQEALVELVMQVSELIEAFGVLL